MALYSLCLLEVYCVLGVPCDKRVQWMVSGTRCFPGKESQFAYEVRLGDSQCGVQLCLMRV